MKDITIAKYLIGHIINKKIIHLKASPTKVPFKIAKKLHVYHMDYVATIQTKNNQTYKVIIGVQKTLLIEDVIQFRYYLASQYASSIKKKRKNKLKRKKEITYPIINIYFLGSKLEHLNQPTVETKRYYYDPATKKTIDVKENFVEQLTHDSYVIQIPYLPKKKRTKLEQILTVFDQRYIVNPKKPYELDIPDKKTQNILNKLIRRLKKEKLIKILKKAGIDYNK